MNYRTFSQELVELFGQKIYKLSLSSGCTCPNRDGRLGYGGCTFCSQGGSGDFASPFLPLEEQLSLARQRVIHKLPKSQEGCQKYLAYFQSFTGTYGEVSRLSALYHEVLSREDIAGLSIATRPDCLEPEKLQMLKDLNAIKPVWVELGLQTIHEDTARRIRRGYRLPVFEQAYQNLADAGLRTVVHVILGLPGESQQEQLETIRYLSALDPTLGGIKLQVLNILSGTQMARSYESDPFPLPTLSEYADLIVKCLQLLPEETTIHRLTGDGPRHLLIAPLWVADKKRVLGTLQKAIGAASRKLPPPKEIRG